MTRREIKRLIGYGILFFVAGMVAGKYWTNIFLWLIPAGTITTYTGVFFFFRNINLRDEFKKDKNDDVLTYFWNVLALKYWTFCFMIWMIPMNIAFFTEGKI